MSSSITRRASRMARREESPRPRTGFGPCTQPSLDSGGDAERNDAPGGPTMSTIRRATLAVSFAFATIALAAHARGDVDRVKHVIVLMQENHPFDNYFGVLPYAPGGPYRPGPCDEDDHSCVDGLSCSRHGGALQCRNSNLSSDG